MWCPIFASKLRNWVVYSCWILNETSCGIWNTLPRIEFRFANFNMRCIWSTPCVSTNPHPLRCFRHRGAETRGRWGWYNPANNLTVSPPIVWVWPTSASSSIIWLWYASERRCPLEFGGKKVFHFRLRPFFLVCTWFWGKKVFHFWSSLNLLPEQNPGRGSSPQCRKYGKFGVKVQIIPPPMLNKDRHPCSVNLSFLLLVFLNRKNKNSETQHIFQQEFAAGDRTFTQGCRNLRGIGGYIPLNNLTVYHSIVWVWCTSASPKQLTLVCIWA